MVIHPQRDEHVWVDITPESAGWSYVGLRVVQLEPGATHGFDLGDFEAILLPLRGRATVSWSHAGEAADQGLEGRLDVFSGVTDFQYLPPRTSTVIQAEQPVLLAICAAEASTVQCPPPSYYPAAVAESSVRGAGSCSRQITNYALNTRASTGRLLVCEAITPGGNWSSFPPHKHDAHTAEERALEETYFFMFRAEQEQQGLAFQRGYGTPDRPLNLFTEIHHGDTVLVPHGYHGPTMAAPGYDLYGLNVMAGPASDRQWLSTDDPAHHWIRATWADQTPDPRLPFH